MLRYLSIIIILLTFLAQACAPKPVTPVPETRERTILQQADQYWRKNNLEAAEKLYRQLASRPDLGEKQRILVLRRLARASFLQGNYVLAVRDLLQWFQADPRTRQDMSWYKMYAKALLNSTGEQELGDWLAAVLDKPDLSEDIRSWAALRLAILNFDREMPAEAMSVLQKAYAQVSPENRQHLQQEFKKYLESLALDRLMEASSSVDRERMLSFPESIFYWVLYAEQLKQFPEKWDILQPGLSSLSQEGEFAHPEKIKALMRKWMRQFGRPEQKIAMLLPLSGTFSSAGWKILRGAELAHWELVQDNTSLQVTFINTHHDNWLEKLQEKGPFSITAGPVSSKNWEKIISAGLNREYPFFTFLPDIDQEGSTGWRFFPGSRDQVQSILDMAVNELGLVNYGIFYPREEYGRSHARSFWEQAVRLKARISGLKEYPPDEPTTWNRTVQSFLKVQKDPETDRYPSPAFEAVFIPDSLSRARALIPQFFYFDQSQLLFMGPMLWSESFTPQSIEDQYFSLAIAPGPWWTDNPAPAVQKLKDGLEQTLQGSPDFWVALGYDFVRFASAMDISSGRVNPDEINNSLSSGIFSSWTMAPIEWNSQGQASQDLFIFRMKSDKLTRVKPDSLKSLINFRKNRKINWLQQPEEQTSENPISDQFKTE